MIDEFQLIHEIKEQFPLRNSNILGIGDDAALIENDTLVCTDVMVDSTHFIREKADLFDVAYKSIMINISDLCAMGAFPQYALLSIGLPQNTSRKEVNALIDGWKAAVDDYKFDLIGGDTVVSPVMFFSVTMIGTPFKNILKRDGAKEGDFIYVSGDLGDSRIGLEIINESLDIEVADREYFLTRHYSPRPRLELVKYLSMYKNIHACIDISDGMGDDLLKLAHASGRGFFLELNELPLSREQIGTNSESHNDYLYDLALNGGEDYELIFTCAESLDTQKIFGLTGTKITPVGRIQEKDFIINYFDKKMDYKAAIKKYRHFHQ